MPGKRSTLAKLIECSIFLHKPSTVSTIPQEHITSTSHTDKLKCKHIHRSIAQPPNKAQISIMCNLQPTPSKWNFVSRKKTTSIFMMQLYLNESLVTTPNYQCAVINHPGFNHSGINFTLDLNSTKSRHGHPHEFLQWRGGHSFNLLPWGLRRMPKTNIKLFKVSMS